VVKEFKTGKATKVHNSPKDKMGMDNEASNHPATSESKHLDVQYSDQEPLPKGLFDAEDYKENFTPDASAPYPNRRLPLSPILQDYESIMREFPTKDSKKISTMSTQTIPELKIAESYKIMPFEMCISEAFVHKLYDNEVSWLNSLNGYVHKVDGEYVQKQVIEGRGSDVFLMPVKITREGQEHPMNDGLLRHHYDYPYPQSSIYGSRHRRSSALSYYSIPKNT